MHSLRGKTVFVSGGSRGIGLEIACHLARAGAQVAIAAKTAEPHPKLPGTIYTAAAQIEAEGGACLPLQVDIRDQAQVQAAVAQVTAHFGGIDILLNNASAIALTDTPATSMQRFDLMFAVNVRGTYLCTQTCLPQLKLAAARGRNPHVLTLAPPLHMQARWFAPHLAYTMAKYGMSMCVLGHAAEFRSSGIAVNALWPRTTIATSAIRFLLGGDEVARRSRTPDIMAEAAMRIFAKPAASFTGRFLIDDTFLAAEGVTDFDRYRIDPSVPLAPDFFVPADIPPPPGVTLGPPAVI